MVRICFECGRPAKFQLKTFDDQTIYLCAEHAKGWHVEKMTDLSPAKPKAKPSESPKKEKEK